MNELSNAVTGQEEAEKKHLQEKRGRLSDNWDRSRAGCCALKGSTSKACSPRRTVAQHRLLRIRWERGDGDGQDLCGESDTTERGGSDERCRPEEEILL